MGAIIEVKSVNKSFKSKNSTVEALKDVNLSIQQGDIYGIIGLSGAGKSTLVRCLNLLEKPSSGTVVVEGNDLMAISSKELRHLRQSIGMIFQHFNLLMQRSVLRNIEFPMEIMKVSRAKARQKALELLEVVGLSDKANAYPSQLSGGQKQRVAIARVLAMNPKILLCDEATSALDPQTTKSILNLLKEINKTYGITIVIITHEMSVVEEVCNRVAIMDQGRVVEEGLVEEIFASPKTPEAKRLIVSTGEVVKIMEGRRCVRIVFSTQSSFEPVVANMVLEFKMPVNILYADTKNVNGVAKGEMILQLPENKEIADRMVERLRASHLTVEEVNYAI